MNLRDAIAGAQHGVFRLETLQEYESDDEREPFTAWRKGQPIPVTEGQLDYWAMIRSLTLRGVTVTRVHIVQEPLTEYLRFELGWAYLANVEAGEIVRIAVGTTEARDFWLVDDDVWAQTYDTAGRLLATTRSTNLVAARQRRDEALRTSVPLGEYLTRVA